MNGARVEVASFARAAVTEAAPDTTGDWRRLTLAAALAVTLLDALLLQRKLGLFTGGFLAGNQLRTLADGVAFLMMAGLLNATLAAPLALAALVAGRRLGLRRRSLQFAAFSTAFVPLAVSDFITYQMWSYLGDTFDFRLMFDLTGRRASEIFAVTAPLLARPLVLLGLAFTGVVAATLALHRLDRREWAQPVVLPRSRPVLKGILLLVALSTAMVTVVSLTSESMAFGLRWTPSGQLFTTVLNRLSDFDRDGYGLLRRPLDPAPFDPRIHPYALEVPGNGIDENGLGGDLPVERAQYVELPPPSASWPEHPPVILFVLESFRADTVGASFAGRPVTPVLDALAREGLKVESAWSHNGFTAQSRYHLLSGSLAGGRQNTTILDDFKNRGYEVGYFSGQDDSFGDNGLLYEAADRYYDARQDVESRYSAYTTPGSLAVPLHVVEQRIGEFLQTRQKIRPLFLYVNFHDTHYPYTHAALENLLDVELLAPSRISPGRRLELQRTYLNTAANVDRAIGRVIDTVQRHVGTRPAVVVTSDHGESLFEGGFLGHGYGLNEPQTRIPLIVSGLAMKIRLPFGQSDLRDAISEALAGKHGELEQPMAEWPHGKRVFQYLGTLPNPSQIGWLSAAGSFTYDFRSDRVQLWESSVRPADLIGEPRRLFDELVHTWESMQLALNANRGGEE